MSRRRRSAPIAVQDRGQFVMKRFDQSEDRRTVVVSKNQRYGSFGSELLLRPDGRLLCCYGRLDFKREVHQKAIIISTDRGRSWSEPTIVAEAPGLVKTLRGESLTRLTDGRIAMVSNCPITSPAGKIRYDGFEIRWSLDGGARWSEPVSAARQGTVPWSNHIVEIADGELLITSRASSEAKPVRKVVMQYRSRDRGVTWEGPLVIAESPNLLLTEPSTIRLHDGRLLCVMRETSYVGFPSYRMVSSDGGRTWSAIEPMPFFGHELYLSQLQSGRVMVAYRHVGGYAATRAWTGDPDEPSGFRVPATVRTRTAPRLRDGLLKIRTAGRGETALYHLQSPESTQSTIRLEVELRCSANRINACAIHIAHAGWLNFYPDRIELPEYGSSASLDTRHLRRYEILRDDQTLTVRGDGRTLLRVSPLGRDRPQRTLYGDLHPDNVMTFGTRSPFFGDLEAEAEGEADWRSIRMIITNATHPTHEFVWDARSEELPNQYEENRMIEIENNYGGPGGFYFAGQVASAQFPNGDIFLATGRQYFDAAGRRSSWIRGCTLREEDF